MVAISLVGFALVLPGVLENVAAVSFAHHPEQRTHNLRKFSAAVAVLAAAQFLVGWLAGRTVLHLLHVADEERVFRIFLILLAGTSALTLTGLTLAYAMCFRRMREVFTRVFLPLSAVFAVVVWAAGRRGGVTGAAIAHAAVAAATGIGAMAYVFLSRDAPGRCEPETAMAESTFQE